MHQELMGPRMAAGRSSFPNLPARRIATPHHKIISKTRVGLHRAFPKFRDIRICCKYASLTMRADGLRHAAGAGSGDRNRFRFPHDTQI